MRQIWPVRSLSYINARDWVQAKERLNLKMLDVRDASDYLEEHISGSINISLGRLPFVWQHDLSPDDGVIILSNTGYHSNKAARILRKHGFLICTQYKAMFGLHKRVFKKYAHSEEDIVDTDSIISIVGIVSG
ncbi:rhodanese-like domain-containing protein [Paenibacillus sp. 22594]